MLQSKTITESLMLSSSKSVIQKLQECREEIIFSDIIDRLNKLIDDNYMIMIIDDLILPRKIKRKDNQHINIDTFYRRDYYRIIYMATESIYTYFKATCCSCNICRYYFIGNKYLDLQTNGTNIYKYRTKY